ncbi:MAG: hypothetical protein ACRDTE_24430 [Pseudonocardiaceae bacterium]
MGSAVAGLALFGALAACAAQPDHVGFGGQPHTQTSSEAPPTAEGGHPAWPAPPSGGTAVPAALVDASALPEGYPRLVWIQGDGRTIGAYGQEGGCTQVHSELREQTQQLVHISFVEVTTSPGPCTMDLRFRPLTVQLEAPMGERTVVLTRS